jgi:SNF2-related domain
VEAIALIMTQRAAPGPEADDGDAPLEVIDVDELDAPQPPRGPPAADAPAAAGSTGAAAAGGGSANGCAAIGTACGNGVTRGQPGPRPAARKRLKLGPGRAAAAGGGPVSERGSAVRGGTLVVCPTAVLRQWERELEAKVSPQAGALRGFRV